MLIFSDFAPLLSAFNFTLGTEYNRSLEGGDGYPEKSLEAKL